MKKFKGIVLCLLIIMMTTLLAGCTTFDNFKAAFFSKEGEAKETIKLAVIEPQTGADSNFGNNELKGIEIAKRVKSEVLGKNIEVEIIDSQSDISIAENLVSQLAEKKPTIVISGYGNVVSLTASKILGEAKIPAIGTTATNPLITDNNDYYFRVSFTDTAQGRVVAEYVVNGLKKKNAVIVKNKGDETVTPMNGKFANKMEDLTGDADSVKDIIYVDPKSPNYEEYVDAIEKSKTKAVFISTGVSTAEEIFKVVKKRGLKGITFIGPYSWRSEGIDTVAPKYPKMKIAVVSDVINNAEEEVEAETTNYYDIFVEKHKEIYATDQFDEETALAFDAYMVAVSAIEKAGTTDAEKIKDTLNTTKNFKGASGKITFNANGEASKPLNIDMIQKGKYVTVFASQQ